MEHCSSCESTQGIYHTICGHHYCAVCLCRVEDELVTRTNAEVQRQALPTNAPRPDLPAHCLLPQCDGSFRQVRVDPVQRGAAVRTMDYKSVRLRVNARKHRSRQGEDSEEEDSEEDREEVHEVQGPEAPLRLSELLPKPQTNKKKSPLKWKRSPEPKDKSPERVVEPLKSKKRHQTFSAKKQEFVKDIRQQDHITFKKAQELRDKKIQQDYEWKCKETFKRFQKVWISSAILEIIIVKDPPVDDAISVFLEDSCTLVLDKKYVVQADQIILSSQFIPKRFQHVIFDITSSPVLLIFYGLSNAGKTSSVRSCLDGLSKQFFGGQEKTPVKIKCVEFYLNRMHDLLNLDEKKNPKVVTEIRQAAFVNLKEKSDLDRCLEQIEELKIVRSNSLNPRASRSHVLIQFSTQRRKYFLVDLAGRDPYPSPDKLVESQRLAINASLPTFTALFESFRTFRASTDNSSPLSYFIKFLVQVKGVRIALCASISAEKSLLQKNKETFEFLFGPGRVNPYKSNVREVDQDVLIDGPLHQGKYSWERQIERVEQKQSSQDFEFSDPIDSEKRPFDQDVLIDGPSIDSRKRPQELDEISSKRSQKNGLNFSRPQYRSEKKMPPMVNPILGFNYQDEDDDDDTVEENSSRKQNGFMFGASKKPLKVETVEKKSPQKMKNAFTVEKKPLRKEGKEEEEKREKSKSSIRSNIRSTHSSREKF